MAESIEERGSGEVAGVLHRGGFKDEGIEADEFESFECGHDGSKSAFNRLPGKNKFILPRIS